MKKSLYVIITLLIIGVIYLISLKNKVEVNEKIDNLTLKIALYERISQDYQDIIKQYDGAILDTTWQRKAADYQEKADELKDSVNVILNQ